MEHKIQCHINRIDAVCRVLPVTKIIVETASFDTQKLRNPDISGKEYQKGPQLGFWNVREYVLFRDGHECQHCHGKSKDPILNVHHLESRQTGGNSPENLITLCETCHKKYHSLASEKRAKWDLPKRAPSFRDGTFMGIMRKTLMQRLQKKYKDISIEETYGYLTKNIRIEKKLAKEHYNDAYCIAGNLRAKPMEDVLMQKKVRRHNRQIHKFNITKGGKRKLNQAPREVKGFCLFDKVQFGKLTGFVTGRRNSGYFILKTLEGENIHSSASCKNLKLIQRTIGYLKDIQKRNLILEIQDG